MYCTCNCAAALPSTVLAPDEAQTAVSAAREIGESPLDALAADLVQERQVRLAKAELQQVQVERLARFRIGDLEAYVHGLAEAAN